jgi:hypothetical protein
MEMLPKNGELCSRWLSQLLLKAFLYKNNVILDFLLNQSMPIRTLECPLVDLFLLFRYFLFDEKERLKKKEI